jgi:CHAD domain-containing protein
MKVDSETSPSMHETAGSQFSSYATPLVDDAILRAAALNADPDAEVLHKLRVALRRLRSLLWAYRPLLMRDFDDKQRALFKYFASAAGRTRDWDILTELLNDTLHVKQAPTDSLRAARNDALTSSRETLSDASIKTALREALKNANRELNTEHERTPLSKFARKRLRSAEGSLHKRMRRASHAKRSDYAAYHEVRKAGKKVRYLLEFFEPLLPKKQLKSAKELKKIQKRFGALNDVVASEEPLRGKRDIFPDDASLANALAALDKERKRRVRAAAKLL